MNPESNPKTPSITHPESGSGHTFQRLVIQGYEFDVNYTMVGVMCSGFHAELVKQERQYPPVNLNLVRVPLDTAQKVCHDLLSKKLEDWGLC